MLVTIAVSLAAALCFASGNAIQHRAAGAVPAGEGLVKLIIGLFTSPQWLFGSAIALTAFGLHITALNLGVVAVVQPFMLGAVLLAVPIRALLDREVPDRNEMLWVAFTVLALVVFVLAANHEESDSAPNETAALLIVLVGFTLAGLWAASARRFDYAPMRGFVFATASGLTFGITAGLMRFLKHDTANGVLDLFTHWHVYALLVGSVLGTTLNQRSYQEANLSVCMPSMNTVNITVALGFGWLVFGEPPAHGPLALALQTICLAACAYGLLQVAKAEDELEARLDPHVHPSAR
ncbi:MAG: DMT family transporter [Nocardioidaceae bacterium]|nr:MAG: DMT family transporter [Nocardioidaceae bacterium]